MSKQQRSETIETEADAAATERTLSELRQASQRWKGEREGIAAERANRLVAGDKAESDRLGVKLSLGDHDDADRLEIVGALSRRLAAWQAQAADRQRSDAETELEGAAQVAQDAAGRFAQTALAMITSMRELESARKTMLTARQSAAKLGIDVAGYDPPNSPRPLISSLMGAGLDLMDRSHRSTEIVERWQAPRVRSQRTPPARRNYTPPPRARNTGDAAEYFGGHLVSKFRVTTIGNDEAA